MIQGGFLMRSLCLLLSCLLIACLLSSCASPNAQAELLPSASPSTGALTSDAPAQKPQLPEKLKKTDKNGVPILQVYVVKDKSIKEMDLETYLQGVVAGEMKNDWPQEALRAQAILARTFVLKFTTEKESKYKGADVSTDIEEAQAYAANEINDQVKKAVESTRGMVLASGGEFVYTWFHAHAGGQTALAKEGLAYEKEEPPYTESVPGQESNDAPPDAKAWNASFTEAEFLAACKKAGGSPTSAKDISIAKKGESGRAIAISVGGQEVSAPELRIALDSMKMRSTLLTSIKYQDGKVVMSGKGYGHGVGMPQWGAYGLAQGGMKGEEIVMQYFKNVQVVPMW
jgi:stage II sporulation protein D